MRLALRVDASSLMGAGHFMRCLTLADAAGRRGANIRFLSRDLPTHMREMLRAREYEFIALDGAPPSISTNVHDADVLSAGQRADAEESLRALADRRWDWVVVDHYALGEQWERLLRTAATRILVIDDLADRTHDCDVLLDQNLYDDMETRYPGRVPAHCRLLLGPRFALLRDEFGRWRERVKPRAGPVERVLVCFGGTDARNYTGLAIETLADMGTGRWCVDVVIGAEHADRQRIEVSCASMGFACHVQTARLGELMAAADLAIGAGGGTAWERCCLGLPALALPVADNQRRQLRDAAAAGCLYSPDVVDECDVKALIGRHTRALIENGSLRQTISRRGMNVVDGRGVVRVLRLLGGTDLELRPATPDDCAKVFEWRNHPSIRAASRNADLLDWPSHHAWFASVLSDPDRMLLIGEREGVALGVVRFDIVRDKVEVSIYVVPGTHARGVGFELLKGAERRLAVSRPEVRECRAQVLGDNESSHRLFATSGYELESTWYRKRLIPA